MPLKEEGEQHQLQTGLPAALSGDAPLFAIRFTGEVFDSYE